MPLRSANRLEKNPWENGPDGKTARSLALNSTGSSEYVKVSSPLCASSFLPPFVPIYRHATSVPTKARRNFLLSDAFHRDSNEPVRISVSLLSVSTYLDRRRPTRTKSEETVVYCERRVERNDRILENNRNSRARSEHRPSTMAPRGDS